MADDANKTVTGPPMICATGAIKTGPARVGHIVGNVSLPRTVALPTAIAVVVGAFLGLGLATMVPAGGAQKWVLSLFFGGGAGWFITTFSPLKGESLATWVGLQVKTLRQQRMVDGKPVVVAVGSAIVARETVGRVRVVRSAVRVPVGRYDDRGVLISETNKNLPEGAHVFGSHVMSAPRPGAFVTKSGPARPSSSTSPGPARPDTALPAGLTFPGAGDPAARTAPGTPLGVGHRSGLRPAAADPGPVAGTTPVAGALLPPAAWPSPPTAAAEHPAVRPGADPVTDFGGPVRPVPAAENPSLPEGDGPAPVTSRAPGTALRFANRPTSDDTSSRKGRRR